MKSFNLRRFCFDHWRILSLYVLLLVTLLITTTLKLHSLLPGFSAGEVQTYQASASLKTILHNPVNAPYLILSWIVVKAHVSQPLVYFRAISAWLGLCILALFCGLLYYWHGHRIALLGTLLFGTSGWFLHITRLGTPEVLVFGLFALVACGVWLQATQNPYGMLAILLLSAGLMYVPGMPWFIGLSIAINWKRLDAMFSKQLPIVTVGTIAAIILLIPLGWAIYESPHIGKVILNLPAQGWPPLLPTLKHIAEVPLHLFVYGQGNAVFTLGHLPVLNIFSTIMFGFGAYVYVRHADLQRFRLFVAFMAAGCVVVGLGGPTTLGLLVPFLFMVVSAGIEYLFGQWFFVFPRNPVAQIVGVAAIVCVVLLAFTYNVRAYFISWPNADSTEAAFARSDIGSPKTSDTIK